MKNWTLGYTGRKGEALAVSYLEKHGYKVLEKNFRCPWGEIDIIARDHDELVFIEVKTRKSNEMGYPEEAVDAKKQRKISQVAAHYLMQKNIIHESIRFDVVAIFMTTFSLEIKLIKDAFCFASF
jgi:putative endonuclease